MKARDSIIDKAEPITEDLSKILEENRKFIVYKEFNPLDNYTTQALKQEIKRRRRK